MKIASSFQKTFDHFIQINNPLIYNIANVLNTI